MVVIIYSIPFVFFFRGKIKFINQFNYSVAAQESHFDRHFYQILRLIIQKG